MLWSRAGCGQVEQDYDAHQKAVLDWGERRGTEPLVVDGPEAIAGLIGHYYRYVVPLSMAAAYIIGLLLLPLIVLLFLSMLWWRLR